ncbi:hypothetical protein XENOCAPTIV_012313 [Xenoophorus captivus]|uniref:Uncharacterized protein n=1 Tax=Xenoophorus captivus TaxID=1517983 RepID=A0ABV0QZZ7_9TELE
MTQERRWPQTEEQEEEGKPNRDIVGRLVRRKQRRNGRLNENCVYRQHRQTKLFTVKREATIREGVCFSWLFKRIVMAIENVRHITAFFFFFATRTCILKNISVKVPDQIPNTHCWSTIYDFI